MRVTRGQAPDGALTLGVYDDAHGISGEGKMVLPTDIDGARVSWFMNTDAHLFSPRMIGAFGRAMLILEAEGNRLDAGLSFAAWNRRRSVRPEVAISNEQRQSVVVFESQQAQGDRGAAVLWTPNPAVRVLSAPVIGTLSEVAGEMQVRIWLEDALHFGP